jgi:hypothetical protein
MNRRRDLSGIERPTNDTIILGMQSHLLGASSLLSREAQHIHKSKTPQKVLDSRREIHFSMISEM